MTCNQFYKKCLSFRLNLFFATIFLFYGVQVTVSPGQVTSPIIADGLGTTAGLGTTVDSTSFGPFHSHMIKNGTQRGGNQFHSFREFSVPERHTASFVADTAVINNIISRVTGDSPSNISGTIISPTNLFFINPNGVIFGRKAHLKISGSFHLSTADYLELEKDENCVNGMFHASKPEESHLTCALPYAFGFLDGNPSDIEINNSTLNFSAGSKTSIVGGNITINSSTLNAPSGQLDIAGAASGEKVVLGDNGIKIQKFHNRGTIKMTGGSEISANNSGDKGVYIRGGKFVMDNSDIFTNNSKGIDIDLTGDFESTHSKGGTNTLQARPLQNSTDGGKISIKANNIQLDRTTITTQTVGFGVAQDRGAAGSINMMVVEGTLSMSDSSIDTSTKGDSNTGNAGIINIEAGSLLLDNSSSISAKSESKGSGGDIQITAKNIRLNNGAEITAQSFTENDTKELGNGGDIKLISSGEISMSGTSAINTSTQGANNTGVAGNIEIKVGNLDLGNSSSISSKSTSKGNAGVITVTADNVSISGAGSAISSRSDVKGDAGTVVMKEVKSFALSKGGVINTDSKGTGNGGRIVVGANSVVIDGAKSSISAETSGGGYGGNVQLDVSNLTLTDSGTISTSALEGSTGKAGGIMVTSNNISISGSGSAISSSSQGVGDAGNIAVNVNNIVMNDEASITTNAAKADGGNIELTVHSLMHLVDSKVTSSVKGGVDTEGGNITMNLKRGVLENSRIIANAFEGKGGNVQITAEVFLADPLSEVSASSDKGVDGEVDIRAPVTNISGNIAPLQKNFSSATSLLLKPCAVRMRGEKRSSLVLAGRDGLPFQPGDLIPSPLYDAAMAAVDEKMAGMNERLPLAYGVNAFEEKGLLPLDLLEEDSRCASCP